VIFLAIEDPISVIEVVASADAAQKFHAEAFCCVPPACKGHAHLRQLEVKGLAASKGDSGVQLGGKAASETTFDGTLISSMSFETLESEDSSIVRPRAIDSGKPNFSSRCAGSMVNSSLSAGLGTSSTRTPNR
jgi:hypothetical protein